MTYQLYVKPQSNPHSSAVYMNSYHLCFTVFLESIDYDVSYTTS